jgi:hypothetical protein
MTNQTKQFIEMSDILAVRLECKDCGSSLLVALGKTVRPPYVCPNCNVPWWDDPDSPALKALDSFLVGIKRIGPLMKNQSVALSLEVSPWEKLISPQNSGPNEP